MRRIRKINTHENQLHLPFSQVRSMAISYDYRVRAFWALVTISMVALCAYIYAINATARNISHRASIEREMRDSSGELDSLEFAYIELRNNVTLELAYEKGFREEKTPLFVSRDKSSALTFNTVNGSTSLTTGR